MILSQVAGYLQERRSVALLDLCRRFDVDAAAMRAMLEVLGRKGRVRRVDTPAACHSGCGVCDPAAMETYEWAADPDREPSPT
jgi:hypothetical protein